MNYEKKNKRKYKRYNTEAKIYFDFAYDLETKVEFELIEDEKKARKRYLAVSRNISAEGLCFVSHKDLKEEDKLYMELYLPSVIEPIHMRGKVKWCDAVSESSMYVLGDKKNKQMYHIGVILSVIDGDPVNDSIHFDEEYGVNWSVVLESVFGSYKMLMGEKYKNRKK